MLSIYLTQFLVITFLGVVCAHPTIELIIEEVSTTTEDNEYFNTWGASLTPGLTHGLSLKVPIKKELPPDMMMQIELGIAGQELVNFQETLCDAFEDEIVAKDMMAAGIPKETFPTKCPIASGDWEIHEWVFPLEKLPPILPTGPVQGSLRVFLPEKPPIGVVSVKGRIEQKSPSMPQLPSLPLRG